MDEVKSTKVYDATWDNGIVKFLISHHVGGDYYASALYYTRSAAIGMTGVEEGDSLEFELHTERGATSEEAHQKVVKWFTKSFGAITTLDDTMREVDLSQGARSKLRRVIDAAVR